MRTAAAMGAKAMSDKKGNSIDIAQFVCYLITTFIPLT
jgi:hypothetical protein